MKKKIALLQTGIIILACFVGIALFMHMPFSNFNEERKKCYVEHQFDGHSELYFDCLEKVKKKALESENKKKKKQ